VSHSYTVFRLRVFTLPSLSAGDLVRSQERKAKAERVQRLRGYRGSQWKSVVQLARGMHVLPGSPKDGTSHVLSL
jgi:hypothetical protein